MKNIRLLFVVLVHGGIVSAAQIHFEPRELFQVPFGKDVNMLGSQIKGTALIIPREFSLDEAGHVYITDVVKHRIVRFSSHGQYQMELRYIATAQQVFAHPDANQNLWLLMSDPVRGLFYGVYDVHAKRLREGLFSQFNRFRLHLDDQSVLHVIATSDKSPALVSFLFDEERLLLKKESAGPPPLTHHEVHQRDHVYFTDEDPSGSTTGGYGMTRVTDAAHHKVSAIQGAVIYTTSSGELYTRVSDCQLNIYEADGSFKGTVRLSGLPSSCAAIRFDSDGNIYQLDGIPDSATQPSYTATMPGMRLMLWQRS